MKQTIRIRPKHSIAITLQGSYLHKDLKRQVFLTRGGDVIKDRDLLPTERPDNVSFTKQKREHIIEWDSDVSTAEGRSRNGKMEAVKWFYENHPHVEIAGGENKYLQMDLFTLENLNDITRLSKNEIKEKIRISNLIQSYDLKTQRDVCFAFGGNPDGMSHEELFVDLLHPDTGRAIVNWASFEKKWNPNLNRDIEYMVIAKKAIAFGIIQTRNNNYVIGQEVVGANSDFDSVVGYLKNFPGRYEYVKHEVQLKDMPEEIKKAKAPDSDNQNKISDRLQALREEAKNLGIKGWQIDKEKSLEVKIANAKAVKEAGNSVVVTGAEKRDSIIKS